MPPVWFMGQAGSYLPDHQRARGNLDLLSACRAVPLACELTLQPVEALRVDAAVVFAEPLLLLEAMGSGLLSSRDTAVVRQPLRDEEALARLAVPDVAERLPFVLETTRLARLELDGKVPLVAQSWGPFTLLCHLLEGVPAPAHTSVKRLLFNRPDLARQALTVLAEAVSAYLMALAAAGVQVLHVSEPAAMDLTPDDHNEFVAPLHALIMSTLEGVDAVKVLHVAGVAGRLVAVRSCRPNVVGLDWRVDLAAARDELGLGMAVQGNLDPGVLLGEFETMRRKVGRLLGQNGGRLGHVVALGDAVHPSTPVHHARAFVEMAHEMGAEGTFLDASGSPVEFAFERTRG
jgi:uroporphyrinogen decarboxylase